MSKGWFDGGDKHTGWKETATGKALTDNEAKRLSDSIPKDAPTTDPERK